MRELSETLKNAQQADSMDVLYKIVLTKGATSYTYDQDRILPSEHDEGLYSHRATVVLDNSDGEFDEKDLKGYDAVISYGLVTGEGDEYSATAPLSVRDQQFDSMPGKLFCRLELEGMPNLMEQDEASERYIPDEEDTKTVKDLANAIVGKTLAPFIHCKTAFEVVWDDGYDTLADTYMPKDGFRIYTGGSRLAALRRVLDFTANVPRFEADGKIHIMKPRTSGTDFDYEYDLEAGHVFFSKAYRNTLVFPNKVIVKSREDDDPQYSGSAQVDGYDSLPDKVKKTSFIEMRLASDDEADDIAAALIAKAEMGCKRGQADVPLNVAAEVFDYDKVTDQRQGDTRTGNLGYVHRRFGGGKWLMTFGFGNWLEFLEYQNILKKLEVYTDIGNYFRRLTVGDLYVEHIYAYLDEIIDGPDLYIRQNWLHLDATGIFISENVLYAIRVPGEAKHNLWKQDSAPTPEAAGDFWLDTNYTPNKVMIWDGDSWEEATPAQLELFGRATIYRELKSTSLTADGLVVLDEVQVGTYGLVKYTDIQAGHILLSKTTKDGLWYEESGVVLDATYGIALYGGEGINAFRTFATKEDYEGAAYKSGQATATSANHLVDTDNDQFEAGDVGKIVYNLVDKTTAIVTDYNSSSDLTLDTDIMASGEGYYLYNPNPAGMQVYIGTDGKLCAGGGNIYIDSGGLHTINENIWLEDETKTKKGTLWFSTDRVRFQTVGSGIGMTLLADSDIDMLSSYGDITLTTSSSKAVIIPERLKVGERLKIPVGVDCYD